MTTRAAVQPRQQVSHRRLRLVFVFVLLWVAIGLIRAPAIARDYFTRAAGAGANVVKINNGLGPPIPPFWFVSIDGEVTEAGGTGPGYHGAMLLLVEPISGWVIVMGAG
jgi:hypothetical protein